ncbi:hypothetical protein ABT083_20245 [Streptomyces goshikiensis]|uniref:hypothetical protein n=1 Tax=Streptomyces goshikiensis TaxID=1942 RepID=UPI0033289A04
MTQRPQSPAPAAGGAARWAPPPALVGFVVLLGLVFAGSYAVGAAAGPVAPGMRSSDPGSTGSERGPLGPHGHGGTGGAR